MCQEYIVLTNRRYCNVFRELQMNFVNLSSLFLRRKRSKRFQSPLKCLIRMHESMSRISMHACFPVHCFFYFNTEISAEIADKIIFEKKTTFQVDEVS